MKMIKKMVRKKKEEIKLQDLKIVTDIQFHDKKITVAKMSFLDLAVAVIGLLLSEFEFELKAKKRGDEKR